MRIELFEDTTTECVLTLLSLLKHKTKKDAAKFLGVSTRTMTNRINKYEELKIFREPIDEERLGNKKFPSRLWKTKPVSEL